MPSNRERAGCEGRTGMVRGGLHMALGVTRRRQRGLRSGALGILARHAMPASQMLPDACVEVVEPPEYTFNAGADEGGGDMPEVVLLNCPGCGGPLDTGASHCTYCGARVHVSADGTRVFIAGMTCQDCGWENAADRLFCGKCGANLMEKCHKCGKANPITLQYCGACGSDVEEARAEIVARMVREAKDRGWVDSPRSVRGHMELFRSVAPLDETVIVFRKSPDRYVDLSDNRSAEKHKTAFVATDRSFIFVEPGSRGLLGTRAPVAMRVPYTQVKSLTVDERADDLVISFEDGEARLKLRALPALTPYERARGIVHYFEPFLPLRLQAGW